MNKYDDIEFTIPDQSRMDELSRHLLRPAVAMYGANPLVKYHSWDHAMGLCKTIKNLYGDISTEEELAAAYHDVVYVPGAPPGYNEDMSAYVFKAMLAKVQHKFPREVEHLRSREVIEIIRCTKVSYHVSPIANLMLDQVEHQNGFDSRFRTSVRRVLDADLAQLAAPWDIFVRNQENIIWEQVGNLDQPAEELLTPTNRRKSAEFLSVFLKKPYIYHTPEARAAHETAAWANIVRWCVENEVQLETPE